MKRSMAVIILTLASAMGLQAQVHTACTKLGDSIDCDSTNPTADAQAASDSMERAGKNIGEAIGTVVAIRRMHHQIIENFEVQVTYAQQNPDRPASAEILARATAYCTVKPKFKGCKFLDRPTTLRPVPLSTAVPDLPQTSAMASMPTPIPPAVQQPLIVLDPPQESLGDIARRYQKSKQAANQ